MEIMHGDVREEIKKIYGDDIEIVSCDIGVCENGY